MTDIKLDSSEAQKIAGDFVYKNVVQSANTLIWELRDCDKFLDDDDYRKLAGPIDDWRTPGDLHIDEMSRSELLDALNSRTGYIDLKVPAEELDEDALEAYLERRHPDYPIGEDDKPCEESLLSDARLRELLVEDLDDDDDWLDFCNDHRLDPDQIEIYEHWIVSDYFAYKLKERGELVVDFLGFTIWGRTCTGQSISMDYGIQQIAIADWNGSRPAA